MSISARRNLYRQAREVATVIEGPLDAFGRVRTISPVPQVELKSAYGISVLRDAITETGTGTVTHPGPDAGGEYLLATSADGDLARLRSLERGRYQPGYEAETGLGVRLTQATWDGEARWGYFDDDDGFMFGLGSNGLFVERRSGGATVDRVERANWNVDRLDGLGPSGLTLENLDTAGYIYQITFTWYGFGPIVYQIGVTGNDGYLRMTPVHIIRDVTGGTTVDNPNLPVAAEIDASGSASPVFDLHVAGRQFSILGDYRPYHRTPGAYRLSQGSVGQTFVPLIGLRKKTAYSSVDVRPYSYEVLTSEDLVLQLRVGADLSDGAWGSVPNLSDSETAAEANLTATSLATQGEAVFTNLVQGGQNVGKSQVSRERLVTIVPASENLVLVARSVGVTDATVTSVLDWREEW